MSARSWVKRTVNLMVVTFTLFWCVVSGAFGQQSSEKRGWNWYQDPPKEAEEINPDFAYEPELPTFETLTRMTPKAVGELMEAQLSFAIVSEEVGEVAQYFTLLDFVRRRSRTFTALTGVALLKNPVLNARTSYPITNAGRTVRSRERKAEKDTRLQAERGEFALVMFSSDGCGFCSVQWGVLQAFQDRTGWNVTKVDVADYPERAARFNVTGTPMTILIRKNSREWFPVSAGAVSLPEVSDNAYRAIRVLKGEISVQQFLNSESDDGGFFDTRSAAFENHLDLNK
ncbi:conjugal transfer protein TraF [Kordiimonas aquimaris]|jgi:conjugal transfer pilus assembly protein TraF|uniref:conjugal transfer protein TraF n=1 Tax=Kordiimonas aquimaris TaxID=707591 RepID=UPI0021D33FE6|nr:conjugal transfer protein TraF [Kordiimonas aquimaris]